METAQPITGQEAVGIQQSMTKLPRLGEASNKLGLAHQILAQSSEWFVCNCVATAGQIIGQEM